MELTDEGKSILINITPSKNNESCKKQNFKLKCSTMSHQSYKAYLCLNHMEEHQKKIMSTRYIFLAKKNFCFHFMT